MADVVKNYFFYSENADPILQKMLSPINIDKIDDCRRSVMNKYTLIIKNNLLRMKYALWASKVFITKTKCLYSFTCFVYLCYNIAHMALNGIHYTQHVQITYLIGMIILCITIFFKISEQNIIRIISISVILVEIISFMNVFMRNGDYSQMTTITSLFMCSNYSLVYPQIILLVVSEIIVFTISLAYQFGNYMDGWIHFFPETGMMTYVTLNIASCVIFIKIAMVLQRWNVESIIKKTWVTKIKLKSTNDYSNDLLG